MELVLGLAVMCENKAVFIRNIFSLDQISQTVLKGLVEQAMGRISDLDVESEENGAEKNLLKGEGGDTLLR